VPIDGSVVQDRIDALGYSRRELAAILSERLGRRVPAPTLDAIVKSAKLRGRPRRCRRSLLDALAGPLGVSSGTLMGVNLPHRLQPGGSVLAARAAMRWLGLVQSLELAPALEQDAYWLPHTISRATDALGFADQVPDGWIERPAWARAAERAVFDAWHGWLKGLIGEIGPAKARALLIEHAQAVREGFSRRPWQRPAPTQSQPPRKRGK
jgi:hypothetical protein